MARTQQVLVESIIDHFQSLPDPRHTKNRRHLLVEVIVISMCGIIVGCEGPTAIERWAKAKQDWLKQVLKLPNGIPSHDCIHRILVMLKPEAFQQCFEKWIQSCLTRTSDKDAGTNYIAIDGKTSRRSHDRASGWVHYIWSVPGQPIMVSLSDRWRQTKSRMKSRPFLNG